MWAPVDVVLRSNRVDHQVNAHDPQQRRGVPAGQVEERERSGPVTLADQAQARQQEKFSADGQRHQGEHGLVEERAEQEQRRAGRARS